MAHLLFALDKKQFIIKLLLRCTTLWYVLCRHSKASAQKTYRGLDHEKYREKNHLKIPGKLMNSKIVDEP